MGLVLLAVLVYLFFFSTQQRPNTHTDSQQRAYSHPSWFAYPKMSLIQAMGGGFFHSFGFACACASVRL